MNGFDIRARRLATGLTLSALVTFLDSKGFSGWSSQSLTALEHSGRELDTLASAEFLRAFEEATNANDGAGSAYEADLAERVAAYEAEVEATRPRSWATVRQSGAFTVALDIARQERNSQIKLDQARAAMEATYDHDAGEAFSTALRFHRNDNNVLWGAARMLAAMVDNDDELGALQVLRDELDRQDAGGNACTCTHPTNGPRNHWSTCPTRSAE